MHHLKSWIDGKVDQRDPARLDPLQVRGIDADVLILQPARKLDQAYARATTELAQQCLSRHLAHAVTRWIIHPRHFLFPANSRCIQIPCIASCSFTSMEIKSHRRA